jgi:hypothetical protein
VVPNTAPPRAKLDRETQLGIDEAVKIASAVADPLGIREEWQGASARETT